MENLAKKLETEQGTVFYRPKGRYPTLVYTTEDRLLVKVGVNNQIAIRIAALFGRYAELDPRVAPLI
jgi:DNA polymerase sigma